MYFRFPCRSCGKKLKADDENIGKKARCPYCKTSQVIPEPPQEEVAAASGGGAGAAAGGGDADDLMSTLDSLDQQQPAGGADPGAAEKKSAGEKGADQAAAGESAGQGESKAGGKPASKSSRSDDSNTDVSGWKSGLLGIGLTLAVYGALYPVRESLGVLFYGRGWVPVAETLLMCWAVGILILKYAKLRRQRDSMLFDVLPNEIGDEITVQNLPRFMQHVRELPAESSQSFLINRVERGLEHFRVRRSVTEVGTMLQSQSDIDNNAVASSYSLLNVFLWAIPILGFIGTVLGISTAVANFSGTMGAAGELSEMKESLGFVMGGLGTAFDTTLLALCLSVILIFPMKSLQKSEEDLLNWVDEYANENLLKRLQDGSGSAGSDNQRQILRAINGAMADHHAELKAWTTKLDAIGDRFKDRASEEWTEIHKRLMEEHEAREQSLSETVDKVTEKNNQVLDKCTEVQQQIGQLTHDQAGQISTVHTEMAESVKDAANSLRKHVEAMQEGMRSLNDVLGELNGKTVTIEQQPRRGGFFGRKKNNRNGG